MNTTQHNEHHRTRARQFGGNSVTESESLLAQLFHIYLEAGLANGEAWDAALADYAQQCSNAA